MAIDPALLAKFQAAAAPAQPPPAQPPPAQPPPGDALPASSFGVPAAAPVAPPVSSFGVTAAAPAAEPPKRTRKLREAAPAEPAPVEPAPAPATIVEQLAHAVDQLARANEARENALDSLADLLARARA